MLDIKPQNQSSSLYDRIGPKNGQPSSTYEKIKSNPTRFTEKTAYLIFSFQYWKEHNDYYGLAAMTPEIISALLTIIGELSKYKIDEFNGNYQLRDKFHYHRVDWFAKGVSAINGKASLTLPDFASNPEFEWYQFSISISKGRIAGFYDSDNVFQIVVIDIYHNLQPSKKHNYQLRKTPICGTPYDLLKICTETTIRKMREDCPNCPHIKEFSEHDDLTYISIDREAFDYIEKYMKFSGYQSFDECLIDLSMHAIDLQQKQNSDDALA